MIEYRHFLNTDPPSLIDIWQKQPAIDSRSQIISRKILDRMVFSKPYFDAAGMILAFDDGEPVGFIHLGFAAGRDYCSVDFSTGILAQIQTTNRDDSEEIICGLWERGKNYLTGKGATICFSGAKFPHSPFYNGLYGGSRVPGIPQDDFATLHAMNVLGFEPTEKIEVWRKNLVGYKPIFIRELISNRRKYQVASVVDPKLNNWWDCCSYGWAELFGFRISDRADPQAIGSLLLWDIQPLSQQWGKSTLGLIELAVAEPNRKLGLGTMLIAETLKQLANSGTACVEMQLRASNVATRRLLEKLDFEMASYGTEMSISL